LRTVVAGEEAGHSTEIVDVNRDILGASSDADDGHRSRDWLRPDAST